MARKLETALVLVLEDADPFDEVRREFAPNTVAKGIPFHITLLYPFAPDPARPLLDCTFALQERFPDWPPYGGAFAEPIPHATLAEEVDDERVLPEIERRLGPHLPRDFTIGTATLLEEFAPDRWRKRERFALGR